MTALLMRMLLLLSILSAVATTSWPDYVHAEQSGDWAAYGKDDDETRFSPLSQVNLSTVGRLRPAWSADLDVTTATSTPLAIGGKVYVAAGLSVVYAIDGLTGKTLWRFDPKVAEVAGEKLRPAWGIRGLAYAENSLFVGTQDGRLLSIDASNGNLRWSVATGQAGDSRFITGAPRVMGGLVIIGHGGADTSLMRGYVTAYARDTGRLAWRFYVVPDDPAVAGQSKAMKLAAKTWNGRWWRYGGGGAVWNAMTYDAEAKVIYIGTGNGTPYNWKIRNPGRGDNLFLCSIVALDATTGKYKWHYQVNPNEAWDYNASMDMILATLSIDGRPRKVLMQAPKNGFFYVIDRSNGKLISAEPFVSETWAKKIDLDTGRPVENAGIRYESGSSVMSPSFLGAHSWQPMAFSLATRLAYIPTLEQSARWGDAGIDAEHWAFKGPGFAGALSDFSLVGMGKTSLTAWDPVRQKLAWRVETPARTFSGVLATAGGLVFQGQADGVFQAYAADSGTKVWSSNIGTPVTGSAISYEADGSQFIAVLVGPNTGNAALIAADVGTVFNYREQPRRLIAFRIDGDAMLPPVSQPTKFLTTDPVLPQGERLSGLQVYMMQCGHCHGAAAASAGAAPDLRGSAVVADADSFDSVVSKGTLQSRGMPRFAEFDPNTLHVLREYLLSVKGN